MMGGFELRDKEFVCPVYGGIDWRERYLIYLDKNEFEYPDSLWFVTDNYELELNETNTLIFNNVVAPELDAIAVIDTRDDAPFWWHRIRNNEEFEELAQVLGGYACVMYTDFPLEIVVNAYEYIVDSELNKDLDELE